MEMAVRYLNTFTVVSLFILALTANGDRLRDDMYEPLYGAAACYRRMNGTHQTGCSSKRGGSVGIVHIVTSQLDVDWVLNNSTGEQYAVVLAVELLTPAYLDRLIQRPDKVAGIVVTRNHTTKPEFFSHESRCPNSLSQAPVQAMQCREDAADSEVWNPHGTSLAHRDFPFPIFFLPPDRMDSIEALYKCFYQFNSFDLENQLKRSLCAVEMDAFMFAAVNSEVCTRKNLAVKNLSNGKFCDPLGDRSVYFTLFPRGPYSDSPSEYFIKNAANDTKVERKAVKEEEKSIFLVTANMDSTSFLEGEGIGAVGTVSGLVTLLATAQLLNTMFPANQHSDYEKNVLFMALNGESYDGIGSQRLAWDLSGGGNGFPEPGGPAPPLNLRTLGRHVHLAQLAAPHTDLRAYTPQYDDDKDDKVNEMLSWLTAAGSEVGVTTLLARGGRHPPSPVHSFLRILNSTTNHISSVVLADHGPQFSNQYYHSVMDDKDNLNYSYLNLTNTTTDGSFPDSLVPKDSIQMRLANISTMVAHTLYRHITGNAYTGGLKASPYIVDELVHCFLETSTCPLLLAALSAPPPPSALETKRPPAPLYVGVTSWLTQHPQQVALLGVLLAGTPINRTQELCHAEDTDPQLYEWMLGLDGKGHCYRANLNYSIASSPAFEIPDYDFKSGMYSSWTESVWAGMSLLLLVLPARHWETTTLVLGCVVSLLSLILVLLTQRHLAVLQSQARDSVETDSSNVDC